MARRDDDPVGILRRRAIAWCFAAAVAPAWFTSAGAASLAEKARESGCVGKPTPISGALYKCATASGAESFFNVPDGTGASVERAPRRNDGAKTTSSPPASPAGFPRVDAETQ